MSASAWAARRRLAQSSRLTPGHADAERAQHRGRGPAPRRPAAVAARRRPTAPSRTRPHQRLQVVGIGEQAARLAEQRPPGGRERHAAGGAREELRRRARAPGCGCAGSAATAPCADARRPGRSAIPPPPPRSTGDGATDPSRSNLAASFNASCVEEARRDRCRDLAARAAPSTSTATATSSREAMNHAWVGGGSPPPYSAVPLLPRDLAGQAGERGAGARRDHGAHQLAQRRASSAGSGSGRRSGRRPSRRGARQRPVGDRRPPRRPSPAGWRGSGPGRSSSPALRDLVAPARDLARRPTGSAELQRLAEAEVVAAVSPQRARGRGASASETNAVLQDCAKSVAERHRARGLALEVPERAAVDDDRRRAVDGLARDRGPSRSSAVVVITLKVEPGG